MKNQFIRIQPSQGNTPPGRSEESNQRSSADELEATPTQHIPAAPPSQNPSAPLYPPKATGKGLLSSWHGNREYPQTEETPLAANPMYNAPNIQPTAYRPATGPLNRGNNQNAPAHMPPYQAGPGVSPFSTGGAFPPIQQSPAYMQPAPSPIPFNAPNPPSMSPYGPPQGAPQSGVMGPMSMPMGFQTGAGYPNGPAYPNTPGMPNGMPPIPPPMMMTPPPTMRPPYKEGRKKRRFPIWARIAVAILLVLLTTGSVGAWYYQTNFANPVSNITGQQAAHLGKTGDNTTSANNPSGDILSGKRINILLLGSDTDGKNAAPLAQTDIIVTINPQTNYVGMLSIPRDLQVSIPGQGANKLDAAFALGWQYVHVGPTPMSNAAGLSIETIKENFGISIDYYAWVGLDGFVKVIDTAGGVDIDAIHPMLDDVYPNDVNNQSNNVYDYKRLYIAPGPQHMNGQQALEYVRTRHSDLVGDFGRSARQQQILAQLKTKLATPSIVDKLPTLAQDLNGHVKTDMQLPDILKLMNFARTLDPNKIDRVILSTPYSHSLTGTTNLAPNCGLIIPVITKMFDLGNQANCVPQTASSGTSSLASIPSSTSSSVAAAATVSTNDLGNAMGQVGQFAQVSTLSLSNGNGDIFGVHSLLDLMFLVVFQSFDAAQV